MKSFQSARMLLRKLLPGAMLLGVAQLSAAVLEIRQNETAHNYQSYAGVPLSRTAGNPPGSDGRSPDPNSPEQSALTQNTPTLGQFQSFISFGGAAAPASPENLNESLNLAENAEAIQLPVGKNQSGTVAVIMKSARVGSPYLSRQVSFLFGSIIPVPEVSVDGAILPEGEKDGYWLAEPYSTNGHAQAPYYWSLHRRSVFAIQPGPISVTWKKAAPELAQPPGSQNVNWIFQSGFYYRLLKVDYVVSGSAAKQPRKIYWTEGSFRNLGKPVAVPNARIGAVQIVYNNNFPQRVAKEFVPPGQVPVVETNRFEETRTLWYDQSQGAEGRINAHNVEGRVFLELLGERTGEGQTRTHLGYEIVDVYQQATPDPVEVDLGERLPAWQDRRSDSDLVPDPLLQVSGADYSYRHALTTRRSDFYATRETQNQNDSTFFWLEEGEVGLLWPFRFVRYKQSWPSEVSKYSHYIRPLVQTEEEAKSTAVSLPIDNAAVIAYQDPFDRPRAKLAAQEFYTFLDATVPAHRTLLRLNAGDNVAFERVFSWLDGNLKNGTLGGSVATNLAQWNAGQGRLVLPDPLVSPRIYDTTAPVGARIEAPPGERGEQGGSSTWAGYIKSGTLYNPNAYVNPFTAGFELANRGAIIPVNAIPGENSLEVHWFRRNLADEGKGFRAIYWPSVIGRYTLQWPASPSEIVLASNDGSGGLVSLQAKGRIYRQSNPALPGYNPNEEHALMIGGQAYALRDDLNTTASSEPHVLLEYIEADERPAMRPFKVLREKPEAGILFDYISEAGQKLQAPMPLPLLPKPVEGAGPNATNYNLEPIAADGDFPVNWNEGSHGVGPYRHYKRFTFKDRKNDFWVYRGAHAGVPRLFAGTYQDHDGSFLTAGSAVAVAGEDFSYHIHASRLPGSLLVQADPSTPLPPWLRITGDRLAGRPGLGDVGTLDLQLRVTAVDDSSTAAISLQIVVAGGGVVITQGPMEITSPNPNVGGDVTYVARPPYLASTPTSSNSFTMRFYYRTQESFDWPGIANAPEPGAIVPYLRPRQGGTFAGDPASKHTAALGIVYRPIWPFTESRLPKMRMGETLLNPRNGLPGIRGQTSARVIYQQSIAQDLVAARPAIILHDPTREKSFAWGKDQFPPSIETDTYQGRLYFPKLPPHLSSRIFFDPNRGAKGHLVLRGEFKDELLGDKYIQLNVLGASDLQRVIDLAPPGEDKADWTAAVNGLNTVLETSRENGAIPGTYIVDTSLNRPVAVGELSEIVDDDTAVDSYAMSASGPGQGYITVIVGNGWAFTPSAEPVSMYVIKVGAPLYRGELKVVPSENPLNELLTMEHTADLGGRFVNYEYEWKISPPVDGAPPAVTPGMEAWTDLVNGPDIPRFTLGGSGIQALSDNYLVMRYRPIDPAHPLFNQWSEWSDPQLAEGWIKRVLAGINPFNQRVSDLFNNRINTDVSIISQAGRRWDGDVALNLDNINNYGLIEIYETVLRRGKALSIEAGINYGPANDALLLAAGYLNDLYMMLGNEAWADAANPTISIGTKDRTYGDIATALFSFKGQVPSLLEEELALLRGRDDFLQPGVEVTPVYNRLIWNYTRGIDSGEVIYALNYNIQEQNDTGFDGVIDAEDAIKLFPQGHGDAYGHYLTALKGYFSLFLDSDFDWVPRTEAVLVLGKPVQVDYLDERKFAAAAAATARAGRQVFDLTWRRDYDPGATGWDHFSATRVNDRRRIHSTRNWGADHWASRTAQGAYLSWVVGNAIVPAEDGDPSHEGIQVIERSTVPELTELSSLGEGIQSALDNAEARLSPLGLPEGGIAFDINPLKVTGPEPATHFEQIYERAKLALNNAVASFDDAKDVTRLMRSEQDSLADLQARVSEQERAFENSLIDIYGTPYPDDIGAGRTYKQGYAGPDLLHYSYVDLPELQIGELWNYTETTTYKLDLQDLPDDWTTTLYDNFDFLVKSDSGEYTNTHYLEYSVGPHGFAEKPAAWTGKRAHPGRIQQAISEFILAHRKLRQALYDNSGNKADLDKAIRLFESQKSVLQSVNGLEEDVRELENQIADLDAGYDIANKWVSNGISILDMIPTIIGLSVPDTSIFGVANGGNFAKAVNAIAVGAWAVAKGVLLTADAVAFTTTKGLAIAKMDDILSKQNEIANSQLDQALKDSVYQLFKEFEVVQGSYETINVRLREFDDAARKVQTLRAEGDRILNERETFRRRSAAVVQGFRTRDAAFRIFRNEKLERYKTLFDLAARYSLLTANAYDYETGLLHTPEGRQFVNRIIQARALGVVRLGEPQFAGSNLGDPGISSVLAEMKADWDVLKGRLGFNNADGYGTTVSLRGEKFRILPGAEGNDAWKDILQASRRRNLLDDADVARYCMQISRGDGLPVPGFVIEFSTTIAEGLNLFGQDLAAGDHAYSPSSFATKLFAAGVAFEGYRGMDNPTAASAAVAAAGGASPADPSVTFLDPNALAATPYVYLVPVGVDSMRSPPLGDSSLVRTWSVDDVTVPLPFNIGASDLSERNVSQSSDTLTEELFSIRKHQAFRPVGSASVFSQDIYSGAGSLAVSQFTNRRLIGRSVWNSRWKLVIPGHTMLNNPEEAMDRFIRTVNDVKLHFVTYSYSGN